MDPLRIAALLPTESSFYAALLGFAFLLAIYAHVGRFTRLLVFAIGLMFVATLLTIYAARVLNSAPENVPLP